MTVSYFMPNRSYFGPGCVNELGNLSQSVGMKKPMIVTDHVLEQLGMTKKIQDILLHSNIESMVFNEVEPNPTDQTVTKGVKNYKTWGCDGLISLGGGSPHDCAKAIGLVISNGGAIKDYEGLDQSKNDMIPMVAVNTTAGTAAEMTRFAIITDTERHVKMAIIDWRITPLAAINDPELMMGMPPSLTAATGMDALTHAIEAYVSTGANSLTDCAALKAIDMIGEYSPKAFANGTDTQARDQMAYAQYLAGVAFNNASLGYVHAMAHQLGGIYDLPHGVCNAILLPYVCEFNLPARIERFGDIAVALGENIEGLSPYDAAMKAITAIKRLSCLLDIPGDLKELGVKPKDFPVMADNAKVDACCLTNPRTATKEEVIAIYQQAYDKK